MKPPRFNYHDPSTLDEALGLLAEHNEAAKILAGGQSLVPVLNFRLARPEHLIDINLIAELSTVKSTDAGLSIGAMTRQRTLERSDLVKDRCPLIGQALKYVGHPQIRNRGTIGGSIVHADPAAELPSVAVALDAKLVLQRKGGERTVAAGDFFLGQLTTVIEPDEMLTRIDVPAWPARTGSSLQEVAMRHGDFALGGVATTLTIGENGKVARARIVCFGVDEIPRRVQDAENSLIGGAPDEAAFAEAGKIVSARVDPSDDIHASAGYRRRLAGILTRRCLAASLSEIKEGVA